MAQFQSFSPGVEVNGETVLSIVDGMGVFKRSAYHILAENGIDNPRPGEFYSQQAWLDAFRQISEKIGVNTLYAIGQKIPENAQFPPEIDSIEKGLASIDVAYHMNHRNGEIGHYHYQQLTENEACFICNNPYPCDFDRGIIEAVADKFKPEGAIVTVVHDNNAPCRKQGGESCTYRVKWL